MNINLTNAEIGMVLVALSSGENAIRRDIREQRREQRISERGWASLWEQRREQK